MYIDSAGGSGGEERNVFDLIQAELCCHHPSNPQYAPAVRPRLARKIRSMMDDLDEMGVIAIYKMPKGGERRVYWPAWTRAWYRPDWDSDYGGTVDAGVRDQLMRVVEGADVPGFVTEGNGGGAEQGRQAAGTMGGIQQIPPQMPPPMPMSMPMSMPMPVPVPRPMPMPVPVPVPTRIDIPVHTAGMSMPARARTEVPAGMERPVMPTRGRMVIDPRVEADGWDSASAISTDSTFTSDSELARIDGLMARCTHGGQQQLQQQQAPPGQGTSRSAKRRMKRRLRGGQEGEDADSIMS